MAKLNFKAFRQSCLRKAKFMELIVAFGTQRGAGPDVAVGKYCTEGDLQRLAAEAGMIEEDFKTAAAASYEEWKAMLEGVQQ
jgi:hypothetical protein